jgi:hypothetical protein
MSFLGSLGRLAVSKVHDLASTVEGSVNNLTAAVREKTAR